MNLFGHHAKILLNSVLHLFGFEIIRATASVSWESSFDKLQRMGLDIQTVIDIGASNGRWSKTLMPFFPSAFYFLIEANVIHEPALKALKRRIGNLDYVLSAAGDTVGKLFFDASDPSGGLASHTLLHGKHIVIANSTTVDTEIERQNLRGPYLLKLDTHGFETSILCGAAHALLETSVVIIETYNFVLCEGCLRFPEICEFLGEKGFLPFLICNPLFRPLDGALWQVDIVFLRGDSPCFEKNTFL